MEENLVEINDEPEREEILLTMDEAFNLSKSMGRYQILRVIESGLIFTTTMVFFYSLPFFEHTSISCTQQEHKGCKLDYPCKHSHIQYIYDYKHQSIIGEFDMLCRKEFVGWIGTTYMLGLIIGSYVFGITSEKIGRIYTICIGECHNIVGALIFVLTGQNTQWMLILGAFILGFGNGVWAPCYNLMYDVLSSAKVELSLSTMNSIFASMEIVIASFMYFHYSWRIQMYAVIGWFSIALLLLLSMKEGPRFLVIRGKHQEAAKYIQRIAKFNGRTQFPKYFKLNIQGADGKDKKQSNFWDIFRYKTPRMRFLLVAPQILIVQFVYFSISLAMADLGGSIQLNTILGGIFEGLAYISTSILVNTRIFGRKYTLFMYYIFAASGFVIQIILNAVNAPQYSIIIMVILRKFGISGAFNVVLLFASELFPSEVRSSVMSVLNVIGGIGSLCAPMVIENVNHSDYVFASVCLFTIFAVLPFPETRGITLLDTIAPANLQKV